MPGAPASCMARLDLSVETHGPLRVQVPRMSHAKFVGGRKGLKEAALQTGAPHYFDDSPLLPALAEMRKRARERQEELHEARAKKRLAQAASYVQRFHRNSLFRRRSSARNSGIMEIDSHVHTFFTAVHRLSQHSLVQQTGAGAHLERFARDGRRRSIIALTAGRQTRRWWRSPISSLFAFVFGVISYVTGVCAFVLATILDTMLLPVTLPLTLLGLRPPRFARSGGKQSMRRRRGRGYMKPRRVEHPSRSR